MEINNLEKFRRTVSSGRTALGTVITSYDSALVELAADCGFDFVWIDMEHSPLTIVDAMHHVTAVRGTDCAAFIRVPWNVNYLLKPVLDLAPAGVIVPMVNDAKTAEAAVRACRYPVHGGERGFSLRRQGKYGQVSVSDYVAASEHDPLVILQIEHREAVEHIDEILQVEGVDSICLGPFDLSASYNKTAQFFDPEISDAIDHVRESALKAGVMLGGFCSGLFWEKRFMNWKTLVCDTDFLSQQYRSLLQHSRESQPAAPSR